MNKVEQLLNDISPEIERIKKQKYYFLDSPMDKILELEDYAIRDYILYQQYKILNLAKQEYENISEHYKKYGVIEGDRLLLETAKNNYQKGYEKAKKEAEDEINRVKRSVRETMAELARQHYEPQKSELIEKIIRRIDNCVISPFEGAFLEGKEILREKVIDLIRTAFNRCCNQLREELDTFKQAEKIE